MQKSEKKIAFAGPWITQKEIDYVMDATKNGFYETFDKDIKLLEETMCKYLGRKYAIATHCCTLALHLACASLGLQKGDEVICVDISWIATAYPIVYTGATPVFVDIDYDSWCIDPKAILAAITSKTKAIMLVHTFGHPAQMDEIMKIARDHNLKVIEDAAPSLGAEINGKKVGTFGDVACFSFHGAKIAASGEGGIFLTDDDEVFRKAKLLASMGRTDSQAVFWSDMLGFQYTIGNISAALARAQVERIDELLEKKRLIFSWYEKYLANIDGIKLIKEKHGCLSNYCYPSFLLENDFGICRDEIVKRLKEINVHCRPAFPRMSRFPIFDNMEGPRRFDNPIASLVEKNGISLPSAANLNEQDVKFVCDAIKEMLKV